MMRWRILLVSSLLVISGCGLETADSAFSTTESTGFASTSTSLAPSTLEGAQVDALGNLITLRDHMIDEGLPLLDVRVDEISRSGDRLSLTMTVLEVAWSPPNQSDWREGRTLVAETLDGDIGTTLDGVAQPEALVVVSPSGEVYGMAVWDDRSAGTFRPTTPLGPGFLSVAAELIAAGALDTGRALPLDCLLDPAETRPPAIRAEKPAHALIEFLEVGPPPSDPRAAAFHRAEGLVADLPWVVDPVVGDEMEPDARWVAIELIRGASSDQLLASMRYLVPFGVDVTELDAATVDSSGIYLYDAVTGRILGWNSLANLAGAPLAITDASPPDPGNGAAVYITATPLARPDCPPEPGSVPSLTIPFDDFAGASRAVIDVGTETYRPLTAEEYRSVATSDS
jgi:hypothetical protein